MSEFDIGVKWTDRGLRSKLAFLVAVLWSIYTLCYLCDLFFYCGIVVYPLTHRAISAGLICILVFLLYPPKKRMSVHHLRWYDLVPILIVIAGCTYIAINANDLMAEGRLIPYYYEMVLASFLFICVIEATRRTTGWILTGIIVISFFYAVYSNHFPGFLRSTGFSFEIAFGWMYLGAEGFWGLVLGIVSTIVAGFIIFGGFLKALGATQFFNDLALASAGFLRGGAAKAAVIASTFFGTISGSTAANVATTGQITIPLMKKTGYGSNYAGAIEATASLGGMFMPPVMGATAFLIAEFLQMEYWNVCVAAFLPAMAYYITLLAQVDLEAAKIGLKGLPRDSLPSLKKTLIKGWPFLLPFILLLFLLGGLRYSAQTSIMYTLAALVIVGGSPGGIGKGHASHHSTCRGHRHPRRRDTNDGCGNQICFGTSRDQRRQSFCPSHHDRIGRFYTRHGDDGGWGVHTNRRVTRPRPDQGRCRAHCGAHVSFLFRLPFIHHTAGLCGRLYCGEYRRWKPVQDRVPRHEIGFCRLPGPMGIRVQSGYPDDRVVLANHHHVFLCYVGCCGCGECIRGVPSQEHGHVAKDPPGHKRGERVYSKSHDTGTGTGLSDPVIGLSPPYCEKAHVGHNLKFFLSPKGPMQAFGRNQNSVQCSGKTM